MSERLGIVYTPVEIVDAMVDWTDEGLRTWLEVGLDFARSLPAK